MKLGLRSRSGSRSGFTARPLLALSALFSGALLSCSGAPASPGGMDVCSPEATCPQGGKTYTACCTPGSTSCYYRIGDQRIDYDTTNPAAVATKLTEACTGTMVVTPPDMMAPPTPPDMKQQPPMPAGVELTINSYSLLATIRSSAPTTPMRTFVAVGLTLKNVAQDMPVALSPALFTLSTKDALVFSSSPYTTSLPTPCPKDVSLARGGSQTCQVAFEMPEADTPAQLTYTSPDKLITVSDKFVSPPSCVRFALRDGEYEVYDSVVSKDECRLNGFMGLPLSVSDQRDRMGQITVSGGTFKINACDATGESTDAYTFRTLNNFVCEYTGTFASQIKIDGPRQFTQTFTWQVTSTRGVCIPTPPAGCTTSFVQKARLKTPAP